MKCFLILLSIFFIDYTYANQSYKDVLFKSATLSIPTKWKVKVENNCLSVNDPSAQGSGDFTVCKYISSEDSDYFIKNEDDKWEAMTEGVPVLADVNVISKLTGLSAIVECRYKDDAGYHVDQCFQAEIFLPKNAGFTFVGKGNPHFYDAYKKIYLSFKLKGID
ncbi:MULTISPECIES: hypothetical protein [unclassified Serratia (in: enterobacteria)]|uniref:hypothetical protein n=1 Tax=unclassified Serratia (in: enterobacteria) TaxID=2647522 RepID=UPI0030764A14